MDCFSLSVRQSLIKKGYGDIVGNIEKEHTKLLKRRLKSIEVSNPSWSDPYVANIAKALVVQQTLLHRLEKLTASCGASVAADDVYGTGLLARGHLESTALLGYVCSLTKRLADADIEIEDYFAKIDRVLFGVRMPDSDMEQFPESVNILTCIEKAEKFSVEHLPFQWEPLLQSSYETLSEYAHPNMFSHGVAMDYNESKGTVRFRGRRAGDEAEGAFLGFIRVSLMLFIDFSDALTQLAGRAYERGSASGQRGG
jgi:hypothetical protein